MSAKPWSPAEVALLKDSFATSTWDELLRILPDRSRSSIQRKAEKLGLTRTLSNAWTEKELNLLREHYPSSDWDTILSTLPSRSKDSIRVKAIEQSIQRLTPSPKPNDWSESEIALLKEHYPVSHWDIVCSVLPNRTPKGIHAKAQKLGLYRSEALGGKWSSVEIITLKEHYPTAPWSLLLSYLPHRTRGSIKKKAATLGISRKVVS